jgi:hypothetical protein
MSQLLEDGSPRRYYCGTTSSQTKPHSCGSLPGAWSFGSSRRERSWHRSWHTRPTGASVRAGKSLSCRTFGAVAQLGEHLLCKQGVAGSIPVRSTPSEVSFRQWIGSIMGSAAVGGPLPYVLMFCAYHAPPPASCRMAHDRESGRDGAQGRGVLSGAWRRQEPRQASRIVRRGQEAEAEFGG